MNHHPSTIASAAAARATLQASMATLQASVASATASTAQLSAALTTGSSVYLSGAFPWKDTGEGLGRIGLTFETSHELLDRLAFISINGGHLTMTDDGPRLDDDNETLFLIGREVRP